MSFTFVISLYFLSLCVNIHILHRVFINEMYVKYRDR